MAVKRTSRRIWLEPGTEVPSYAIVNTETGNYRGQRDVDLILADCTRNITLHFGWYDKRGRRKMLAKLNRLESALAILRGHLEAEE